MERHEDGGDVGDEVATGNGQPLLQLSQSQTPLLDRAIVAAQKQDLTSGQLAIMRLSSTHETARHLLNLLRDGALSRMELEQSLASLPQIRDVPPEKLQEDMIRFLLINRRLGLTGLL